MQREGRKSLYEEDGSTVRHDSPASAAAAWEEVVAVKDLDRQKILDAFGITEDDLGVLEAKTGWNAAREAADQEREEFVAALREHAADVSAELSQKLGIDVKWDDSGA